MIRKSTINLNFANTGKKRFLSNFLNDYNKLINFYIDFLWEKQIFHGRFIKNLPHVKTNFSKRIQQCCLKQAFQIVKSQRKRKKKTKPVYKKHLAELDSRFIEIREDLNSFDLWIKLSSIGNRVKLHLPSKKHFHFNKFQNWKRKSSIRIYKNEKGFFADIYFEKEIPKKKSKGKIIGYDIGYKKLLADSDGNTFGMNFQKIAEKISRKSQGSKSFKRSLIERDEFINTTVKSIDISNIKKIIVEDLRNVKHKSKGKIRKKFNNKLQRWVYPIILNKLEMISEENGVHFLKINPAFTSQVCSRCQNLDKSSRKGEVYICKNCGLEIDSDINAARNILNFGLEKYGFQRQKDDLKEGFSI